MLTMLSQTLPTTLPTTLPSLNASDSLSAPAAAIVGSIITGCVAAAGLLINAAHQSGAARFKTHLESYKVAKEAGLVGQDDAVWARQVLHLIRRDVEATMTDATTKTLNRLNTVMLTLCLLHTALNFAGLTNQPLNRLTVFAQIVLLVWIAVLEWPRIRFRRPRPRSV